MPLTHSPSGDPERMVLWGQSAGGSSVGYYSYAYPKDPIVKGLSADSGDASLNLAFDATGSSFTSLAAKVGCGELNPQEELECMQKVNGTELQQLVSSPNSTVSFGPRADNVTAFANTTERLEKGLVARIVRSQHI